MRMKLLPVSVVVMLSFAAGALAQAPPSEAQIRRDIMNPGVIAIIMRGQGSFTRFRENGVIVDEYYRSITVRRKTEKPGITVDVIGDAVYRLIGGRWLFRRMRLAGNTYAGIANPTIDELNKLVATLKPNDVDNMSHEIIGEIESIRLLEANPNWEFHSPTSVSFNVVLVHSYVYRGGAYTQTGSNESAHPKVFVDRVERIMRWRIYRDNEKSPWARMTWTKAGRIGDYMRNENGESVPMMKLLERKIYSAEAADRMPRPSRVPFISK